MIELYNAIKSITKLLLIQNISKFNLGIALLKSVSILNIQRTKSSNTVTINTINNVFI